LRWAATIAFGLGAALVSAWAMAQTPGSQAAAADRIDLASVALGGRVEFATSYIEWEEWTPVNLITENAPAEWGWSATQVTLPQELVFSFFTRQSAVIDTVVINPLPKPTEGGAAKEVEIWTSMESATDGFTQVATAMLEPADTEQAISFAPVEAKFVKLRILSAQPQVINNEPNPWPARLRRVRIFEGSLPGYVPLLSRNEDLAALAAGVIPAPPADAAGPPIPVDGPACVMPTESPRKLNFAESRRVLVISPDTKYYTPTGWKAIRGQQLNNKNDYSLVERVEFTGVAPRSATPALLLPQMGFDTVVFSMVCEFDEIVSPEFQQALLPWVAAGHKVILQDSDRCGSATGHNRFPTYSFLPYPFATVNPGAAGAKGVAHLLESSSLISGDRASPSFVNIEAWVKETDGNGQEIGDSNLIVKYDPHWCGAVFARNAAQKNGFLLAYARYGRGLIIYDGADYDQVNSPDYDKYLLNILAQPFDPDNLPCSQPLGDFVLTTDNGLKTQHMAAGSRYTYPLTVYSNNAYAGSVTINASVSPADPTVSVSVEPATVELGELATATVTVTTTAATPATSHIVALRGVDTAGKSNVLCLNLPERRSGSVQVLSGLRQDKKPPKNIEIILDASGSMKAMLGGKSRWAVAQGVLKEVAAKLPEDFSVGLRAYGHTLSSKDPNTCTDTALVLPVVPLNADQLLALAQGLAPRGETPLVYSILQTPADLQDIGGGTVILITDGEESCKGDFAAAEATLKASGLNLVLNIVGFTLDNDPAEAQLTRLAESTGGNYYGAASGEELARALLLAAVDRLPYRILDASGTEVAQGEAGVGSAHELPAGDYTVVITAADLELRTPVTVEIAKDSVLTAAIKGSQLVVEEGASAPASTTGAAPTLKAEDASALIAATVPEAGAPASAEAPPASTGAPGVATGAPPASTEAPSAPAPAKAVAAAAPFAPANLAPAFAVQPGEVARILQAYKALPAEVGRAAFDVKARASALGPQPQAAFEFVRDQIAGEPYPGVLRGAAGTLSAGAGNDLDKALLLAALLGEGGHQVRFAHCVLEADDASALVRSYFVDRPAAVDDDDALSATLIRMLERQGLSAGRGAEIVTSRKRIREWLDSAVLQTAEADLALVRETLERAGIRPTPVDPMPAVIDEARQHYWLQLSVNGAWQDLDPTLPAASTGRSLCSPSATYATLPAELFQAITINVRNEYVADGALSPEIVLTRRVIVSDHYGDVLLFNNTTSGQGGASGSDLNRLVPMLTIGAQVTRGEAFEVEASESAGFDPFGSALSGGGDPARLVAQWLDFTFEAPGRKSSVSRALVDSVPPAERAQGSVTSSPPPDSFLMSLGSFYAIALTAGPVNAIAAMESKFASLDAELVGRVFDAHGETGKVSDEEVLVVAAQLLGLYAFEFGMASERALVRMASAASPDIRMVRDQPMVTIGGIEFQLAEGDAVSVRLSIDLRHDAVRVAPSGPKYVEQAFWLNVRHGLVDGSIERNLPMIGRTSESQASSPILDTSSAIAAARAAGVELRGATGADAVALLQGELVGAGGLRLTGEVHDGIAIVAPVRPPVLGDESRLGIWTIDLGTGQVYALGGSGLRVVIVEYRLMTEAIATTQIALAACLQVPGRNCYLLMRQLALQIQQLLIYLLAGGPVS
jgi:transglutaminase-like putative cysteine protease